MHLEGEAAMDGEHRIQVELLRALEQGLALGKSHSDLLSILTQLVDFSGVHFMSEQLLMRLYAYPQLDAHQAAHDKLMDNIQRVMTDFASGELSLISAELLMLKQWLLDHIRTEDLAFHAYLNAATPQA